MSKQDIINMYKDLKSATKPFNDLGNYVRKEQ